MRWTREEQDVAEIWEEYLATTPLEDILESNDLTIPEVLMYLWFEGFLEDIPALRIYNNED